MAVRSGPGFAGTQQSPVPANHGWCVMLLSDGRTVPLPPQALAEQTPILVQGYWYGADGLTIANQHATYAALYRSNPYIFAGIRLISWSVASLQINVWDQSPPNGK